MGEGGYAHSSDDRQDNRTCRERRGIRIDSVSKERSTFTLDEALETKRKSKKSDEERVRDFQRKLYRKAKQEESNYTLLLIFKNKEQKIFDVRPYFCPDTLYEESGPLH
jgi:hypothetical protein